MQLSVIILNYNVRYFLELCVKSVLESVSSIDAEVIVVDNNSSDNSSLMLQQVFKGQIRVIENKVNLGFSKAYNQAVESCLGNYICILNPDTVVAEDTFIKTLDLLKSKKELGALGCRMIDGSGKFLPESKRNIPSPKIALKKIIGDSKNYYASLDEKYSGYVEALAGAFIVMSKSKYIEVGGFDEDYFMYGEDIDLSLKLLKAGYKNYYCGDATIIHFKGESTLKNHTYAKRFYGAMYLFYKKHFNNGFLWSMLVYLMVIFFRITYFFKKEKVYNEKKSLQDKPNIITANNLSYKELISTLDNSKTNFYIQANGSQYAVASWGEDNKGSVIEV